MLQALTTYKMYIGGKWLDSSTGKSFEVTYPYTGEVWARVPRGNAEDVDVAVRAARQTFEDVWGSTDPAERARLMRKLADLVLRNAEKLAKVEVMQNGKLIREMVGQMKSLPEYFHYFAGLADKVEGEVIPYKSNFFIYTMREPVGVVAAITPWNSPLLLTTFKLAPGLATGNTFVVKPSSHTPVSALELGKLIEEAGFPSGVVNIVTGFSSEVGEPLIRHPEVAKIAFTGSTEVGRRMAEVAGAKLMRVTLELGGKSPQLVFEDADIDAAVNGILAGIFAATGQTCVAGSRLFVHAGVYDKIVAKLVQRANTIRLGDPMDPETEIGTIAFREQLDKVMSYIESGKEEGAELLCGGYSPREPELSKGLFVKPTIFAKARNDMKICREEIFGPVLAVMKFEDEDEAVRLANDTEFGLAAGVWTKDLRRAHRLARRLKAGTVWINCYRSLSYSVPFGGYKVSGIGRENGIEVMKEYTQVKSVWLEMSGKTRDPFIVG